MEKQIRNGMIKLEDYMGSDSKIIHVARTSHYTEEEKKELEGLRDDRKFLRFLMRKKHTSPFEFGEMIFYIEAPLYVLRQLFRHRTASASEQSGRYSIYEDKFDMVPIGEWRGQSTKNKQQSEGFIDPLEQKRLTIQQEKLQEYLYGIYERRLEIGVSKEQARMDLPLSTMVRLYWKMDLHNMMGMIYKRVQGGQKEILDYVEFMKECIQKYFPMCHEAFEDYYLYAVTFSREELKVLSALFDSLEYSWNNFDNILKNINTKSANKIYLSSREIQELRDKFYYIVENQYYSKYAIF